MIDIKMIADEADMIVNGYAFKRCKEGYRVLNLNRPDRATVLSLDGKVLETSMDDIEIAQYVSPMLTTMHIPIEEMGKMTAKILIDRIRNGHTLPLKMSLPYYMAKRESCK